METNDSVFDNGCATDNAPKNQTSLTTDLNQQASHQAITIENETIDKEQEQQVQLSDFVGEHGAYQFTITTLLFIRYVFLGLMANSGPLMTPDVTFYCSLPMTEVLSIMPNISGLPKHEQEVEIKEEFKQICQIDLHLYQNQSQLQAFNGSKSFKTSPLGKISNLNLNFTAINPLNQTPRIRECVDFTYDLAPDQGRTMTSEFDLICDRDWLRSLFQSLLSAAIVVAHVFWGTFSDKYGRFQAQRLCLVVSLIAGLVSIFAIDFWTFTTARALCSFGDLGVVVSQTTIVVELVGQHYRGSSVALVNFGFALGVSMLPYLMAYFEDFRLVTSFTVLCHMITMPFILATNESPRWLLTNRKFTAARKELKRIARWNQAWHTLWGSAKFPFSFRRENSPNLSKAKKFSSKEQRQRFKVLFHKLIEQIEYQNLYDPVAGAVSEQHRPPPSPKSAIVQQPRIHTQITPEHYPELRLTKGTEQCPTSGNIARASPVHSPKLHEHQEIINKSEIYDHQSGGGSVGSSSGSNSGDNDASKNPRPLRRTMSCNQLDAISVMSQQSAGMNTVASGGGPKWKTLTLPVVSQASSICDYEDDDSYYHSIRRRHLKGQQQQDCITSCHTVAQQLSFVGRVSRLFKDKKLMVAVFTIVWTTFNSELLYTSFIIINLEVGEDVYLNYVLGGCMEALAAISASLLLSYSPRRVSLISFWLLISMSCFGLSLAHIDSTWAVWMLALAKFSQSSLSSIASVAAYESFPTFLRQSGSGLVFTLGMMGSVFAPLIFAEFDDHAGMDRVLMTFSCSSLTAAAMIYLFLSETIGCELK